MKEKTHSQTHCLDAAVQRWVLQAQSAGRGLWEHILKQFWFSPPSNHVHRSTWCSGTEPRGLRAPRDEGLQPSKRSKLTGCIRFCSSPAPQADKLRDKKGS